jgi:hypothetical protein
MTLVFPVLAVSEKTTFGFPELSIAIEAKAIVPDVKLELPTLTHALPLYFITVGL